MYIGIDYSLRCPAIAILPSQDCKFEESVIEYLTSVKTAQRNVENLWGEPYPEYSGFQDRIHKISHWAVEIVTSYKTPKVFIEGYSHGSTGKHLEIAENCGLLKYKLFREGVDFVTVPPTTLKKFATGKGNADKALMAQKFQELTGRNINEMLGLRSENPSSDIIDAFFLARYHI